MLGQSKRLGCRAVGDDQRGRIGFKQRPDNAARCATRTKQQNALTSHRKTQIHRDVAHHSGTVGIVTKTTVVAENQCIDRSGQFGARRAAVDESKRFFLERQGDIGTAPASGNKSPDAVSKTVTRRQQSRIGHIFAGLPGKGGMDQR